jgi:hypothetical protein
MDTQTQASTKSHHGKVESPKHVEGSDKAFGGQGEGVLGSGSFTTFWTWRGNGQGFRTKNSVATVCLRRRDVMLDPS